MAHRTRGLLPLPPSEPALRAELRRLEYELSRRGTPAARRLLAVERRRVVLALDAIAA